MTKLTTLSLSVLIAALGLSACGTSDPPGGGATDAGVATDAGAGTGDAGEGVDGGGLSCSYPPAPYGTRVGANLEPFTLPQCDGTPYSFVNEEFCAARFTVISIAAGWCMPCRYESQNLTEQVTSVYGPRGVRVIQVLVQDDDYRAANGAFCDAWVARYNLTQNIELIDADGTTQIYFPGGSLPSTIIVDSHGTIVWRENGVVMWLGTLKAKLDMLLAGP